MSLQETTVASRIVLAGVVRNTFTTKLRHKSYESVESMLYNGMISLDEWEYFVHRWRTGAYRWSSLGAGACNWCKEVH